MKAQLTMLECVTLKEYIEEGGGVVERENQAPIGKRVAVCIAGPKEMQNSLSRAASFVANHPACTLTLGTPSFADQSIVMADTVLNLRTRIDFPHV
eukprot:1252115-Amphidinium_carterae.1